MLVYSPSIAQMLLTMELVIQVLLYTHIIAGGLCLLSAPVAIAAKKTGALHRQTGLTFFISMAVIFLTALVLGTYNYNPFLLMIAVFSFYSVYSGYRITKLRGLHKDQPVPWHDKAVSFIAFLLMLSMLGTGAYMGISGSKNQAYIVLIVFGLLGLNGVIGNVRPFFKRPDSAAFFYRYHMGNMLGGFIAATTAFTVQTLSRIFSDVPNIIFWLGPTVIIVPIIIYFSRKYSPKTA